MLYQEAKITYNTIKNNVHLEGMLWIRGMHMKQRIIAVGMVFIIAAIYIKQWYTMIPQFADATMADHFRYPVVLLCFVGYILCKTEKQKWIYSLSMAAVCTVMIGFKLYILRTPFIILEITVLPTMLYFFYKFYFDWLLWIEIQYAELKRNIENTTNVDGQLLERFQKFSAWKDEHMERFQMKSFLYQEEELLAMHKQFAQGEQE